MFSYGERERVRIEYGMGEVKRVCKDGILLGKKEEGVEGMDRVKVGMEKVGGEMEKKGVVLEWGKVKESEIGGLMW